MTDRETDKWYANLLICSKPRKHQRRFHFHFIKFIIAKLRLMTSLPAKIKFRYRLFPGKLRLFDSPPQQTSVEISININFSWHKRENMGIEIIIMIIKKKEYKESGNAQKIKERKRRKREKRGRGRGDEREIKIILTYEITAAVHCPQTKLHNLVTSFIYGSIRSKWDFAIVMVQLNRP